MSVCHDTDMIFDPTQPDVVVRVRWYFVPWDAPVLDLVHNFEARSNWERDREWHTNIGEAYLTQHITQGLPPPGTPPPPRTYRCRPHGDRGSWLNGVSFVDGFWQNNVCLSSGAAGLARGVVPVFSGSGTCLSYGVAAWGRGRSYAGSGECLSLGVAAWQHGYAYAGSGECLSLGVAAWQHGYAYAGSGECLSLGVAAWQHGTAYAGSGECVAKGSAAFAHGSSYAGSGECLSEGAVAAWQHGYAYAGSGECVSKGSATLASYAGITNAGIVSVNSGGSAVTSIGITGSPASGDVVTLAVTHAPSTGGAQSVSGITDTKGNTWTSTGLKVANGNLVTELWTTVTTAAGSTTATVAFSAAVGCNVLWTEWHGLNTPVAIDAGPSTGGTGTTTSATTGSITGATDGDLYFAVIGCLNATSVTSISPWSNLAFAAGGGPVPTISTETQGKAAFKAATTVSGSWTFTGSSLRWAAGAIAFKAAAA